MSMSLTMDDLQAIRVIVEDIVETNVEDAKQQTAAGFAEVDKKFANIDKKFANIDNKIDAMQSDITQIREDVQTIDDKVTRIERVQNAEIERVDRQNTAIQKIRKTLKTV